MIEIFLLSLFLFAAGGLLSLATARSHSASTFFGVAGAVLGGLTGLVPAAYAATGGHVPGLSLPWPIPGGALTVGIDALSGFFLLPALLVSVMASLYGAGYLSHCKGHKRTGFSWLCFDFLCASIALVLTAQDGLLFLVAWETMAFASFFLVAFEHEREEARSAAWTYLVAAHLGGALLLVFFAVLGAGGFGFESLARMGCAMSPGAAGAMFVLALLGFGTKAGFFPLHVWLPEAHPEAPSHVSALLSAVMIKTGIYGILRSLSFFGPPPAWWGHALLAAGCCSAILGILLSLGQRDIKRILAYSSVENAGIIAIGAGLGLIGVAHGRPMLAALGFAGALMHVFNHAMFKSLLFMGAGAVVHSAGTRDAEKLGGLMKRMPATGALFLTGSAAICGIPPLCGFAGEFLVYFAAFGEICRPGTVAATTAPAAVAIIALALCGGLAVAAFTRVFGIVFLGEPRGQGASAAREAGAFMLAPMVFLALVCALVGMLPFLALRAVAPAVAVLLGAAGPDPVIPLASAAGVLAKVVTASCVLLGLVTLLALLRYALLRGRAVERTVTWDCGYAAPCATMQYTASSFSQPITHLMRALLRVRERLTPPEGLFPGQAGFDSATPDLGRRYLFGPLFAGTERLLGLLLPLQHGRVHVYVLYIVLTLIVLLVYTLW